jgi:hypothetical protein
MAFVRITGTLAASHRFDLTAAAISVGAIPAESAPFRVQGAIRSIRISTTHWNNFSFCDNPMSKPNGMSKTRLGKNGIMEFRHALVRHFNNNNSQRIFQ